MPSPPRAADAVVHQGMLESSNVQPILQVTDLIRISRTYESISQLVGNNADLSSRSIQRLGAVQ